jgi:hypothetical protein
MWVPSAQPVREQPETVWGQAIFQSLVAKSYKVPFVFTHSHILDIVPQTTNHLPRNIFQAEARSKV